MCKEEKGLICVLTLVVVGKEVIEDVTIPVNVVQGTTVPGLVIVNLVGNY
ncbi:hypothetical protein BABL1_gene_332 [Candidatus Babela massiliensis]|uniref:Uncharacterized protein n=1 Tax=Candidatus Babela massiliensis TaxID=673862 RepID=A0A090LX18_9BACT|nr:hypothetical protein BABL1_gene_332 [Candidatus Babela massiliensis]